MKPRRRWLVHPQASALVGSPFPPLIRHLLYHRGVRSEDEAARFLFLEHRPECDPHLLPGVERAVERLSAAIAGSECIAVFGDFDVDGVTAAALLAEALAELGARVITYIPNRFSEGYGLNVDAITSLRQRGASLLLAADCGTSSVQEVEHACRLGMDAIILDHHAIPPKLPPTVALVNPKLLPDAGQESPLGDLASVGVAYKAMAALYQAMGRAWQPQRFLDLVAIGTVADVAPLVGENRYLVKEGLAAIARAERPGLCALIGVAGLRPEGVDSEAIAYTLGPRLNAAGRLADANLSLRLLLTQDEGEAAQAARQLNTLNQERQRQTEQALATAAELLTAEDAQASLIFVGHPDISEGIVGLVAGRLADERYRPVIVYQRGESESRGSCRSIPEFNIVAALGRQAHLLVRYGGHARAAGFTVANANLLALKEGLMGQAASELAEAELSPALAIDAELPLSHLRGEDIRWLQRFQPHGQGNPEPTFLSRGVFVAEARLLGNNGQHLRLKLKDGPVTWPAIAFDMGERAVEAGQRVDVVYSLASERRSDDALELRIKDLAPSG
ncbi:MAG: single-stranded-DNA-specific exonuclease RecJ [Dehalococcoidia bacterium]|nr:single-stranded-DNA-specific exonuclease RecJ [Dehalococcoidia bacterium]